MIGKAIESFLKVYGSLAFPRYDGQDNLGVNSRYKSALCQAFVEIATGSQDIGNRSKALRSLLLFGSKPFLDALEEYTGLRGQNRG